MRYKLIAYNVFVSSFREDGLFYKLMVHDVFAFCLCRVFQLKSNRFSLMVLS